MKFVTIQDDGQGVFLLHDENTGKDVFGFVTQVIDEIKLIKTLQGYLDIERAKEVKSINEKNRINSIITKLV